MKRAAVEWCLAVAAVAGDANVYKAIRARRCRACQFHLRTRGVPCLVHTLPREERARAKAIGVTR